MEMKFLKLTFEYSTDKAIEAARSAGAVDPLDPEVIASVIEISRYTSHVPLFYMPHRLKELQDGGYRVVDVQPESI